MSKADEAPITSRRAVLGGLAAAPLAAATGLALPAVAAPALVIAPDELRDAYSQWLFYERDRLYHDAYDDRDMARYALRFVPQNTRSGGFHFPLHGTCPSPFSRALAVMTVAGVDLRSR